MSPSRGHEAVIRFLQCPLGAHTTQSFEAGTTPCTLQKNPQDINLVVDMTAWREGTGT
jgi:hypothetical protein